MSDILGPANAANAVTTRITETRVFPTSDTWFKPCTTAAAQDGTQIQSLFLNGLLAQLRAAIRGNGKKNDGVTAIIAEDNTNDAMLLGAILQLIQRGQANFVADTGTADAIVVAPTPALAEYEVGLRLLVLKNPLVNANATTTPTINAGLGAVTIVKNDGSALGIGDLKKGGLFEIEFDASNHARLVSLLTISDAVAPATAAVTVYVDSTSGSDTTGTGSQTAPFKTNLKAYTYLAGRFSFGTFGATIQMLTAGQYDLPPSFTAIPNLTLIGNTAAPGTYGLTGVAPSGSSACCAVSGCSVKLDGVIINNTTPTKSTLAAVAGGNLTLGNVNMTASAAMTGSAVHVLSGQGGSVSVSGNLVVNQSATALLDAEGGNISVFGTITPPSGGSFSNAVVVASHGYIAIANGTNSFSGSTSGKRYNGSFQSTIQTFGGGASLIPGTTAGTVDAYSQYV